MSGLESDVCKIQHLHVTLEGAFREFRNFDATLHTVDFDLISARFRVNS